MSRELSLEVNKRCNFSCSFCYTDKRREDLPDLERVFGVIDQAIGLGVTSISLTGGEPMLQRERVVGIAKYCKANGLDVRLNTNGSLLPAAEVEDDFTSLIDEFQISCDAADAASFSKYSGAGGGRGKFGAVITSIRYLLERGRFVSVRFTASEETIDSLSDVYELFSSRDVRLSGLAVRKFKVRTVVPASDALREKSWRPRDSREAFDAFFARVRLSPDVSVHFKDGSGDIKIPSDVPHLSSPPCKCGVSSLHVSSDLRSVTPCVFLRDRKDFVVGSLRSEETSLADYWGKESTAIPVSDVSISSPCAADGVWRNGM